VTGILSSLGSAYSLKGEYTKSSEYHDRAIGRSKALQGGESIEMSELLNQRAVNFYRQRLFSKAVNDLSESQRIQLKWMVNELPLLPDQARSAQLRQLGGAWLFTFGWIANYPPAKQLALETRLNRQGLLLEIEQRQALSLTAPGVDRVKVEQLHAMTQQLTSMSLPPDRRAEVRDKRDKLQADLYRQNPELQIRLVTPAEVAKALPADAVLVEFQRYWPFDGRKPINKGWGDPQYIALVLKPDSSISAVPLGPAAAIDAQVQKGLNASAQDLRDAEVFWTQLSNQVLKPLLPQLGGRRQWFLSPDGELNRVPFAALPAPQQPGAPLAQVVQLRVLTTGRELLRLQQPAPAGRKALVMANPSYDRPGNKAAPAVTAGAVSNADQRRSAELGSSQWPPLPASEREGQQVASLLSSGLISGSAATTMALQRQQGPLVLHIATHGFFVADPVRTPQDPLRQIDANGLRLRGFRHDDPLLRSGLVLAGANQPVADPNDDGYLTAAEALTLNLRGSELVVLSACSTGQGEIRSGEGVYGLQRALAVAGARSTLLSLWKVDDAATQEFMVRFYRRIKAGKGRADALAEVQKEFRSGIPGKPDGWKEPYYWAAWQLVGDWRPIKGL